MPLQLPRWTGADNPPGIRAWVNQFAGAIERLLTAGAALGANAAPNGPAGGDLGGQYPAPTVIETHLASPLPVAQGGMGGASLAAHAVLVGEGTSPVAQVAPGPAGNVLTSNGPSADPSFQAPPVGVPTGAIFDFAGTAAPSGWLLCDGSSYSTSTYANLFAVIGYAYGGSGSSFNVPDARGRVSAGYDSGNASGRLTASTGQGVSAAAVGNSGGEQAHAQQISEMPSHNHTINDPGHSHSMENGTGSGGVGGGGTNNPPAGTNSATTGITVNTTGGGNAFNVVQPTIIFLKIIKT